MKAAGIIIFVFFVTPLFGQTSLPDSIAARFSNQKKNEAYVDKLNALASEYLKKDASLTRRVATHTSEIASALKYTKGYARSLTVIGNSYWYEGVYEFAQNYYLLAARQYQSIPDSIGLGQTYNNIGEVYKRLKEYDKALEYLTSSALLKKNDPTTRAITLYNIGELYNLKGDEEKAVEYFNQSLSIAIRENEKRSIAYCYWGMGLVKFKKKNYEDALDYFTRSEKIWRELGELRNLIQLYQDVSDIYRSLKLYDKAERYLMLAAEFASLIKVSDLLVNNYYKLAQLDSVRGNYDRALNNLFTYNTLRDSVYSLQKSEQITRLQMIYETENKEQENKQLKLESDFKEEQLKLQTQIIFAISVGLVLAGIMAWLLYRQRHKILTVNKILHEKNDEINSQKLAIEMQASALIKLNEELKDLNRTLEQRIRDRTQQLILQNQKLSEYTFVNAHKLRAPVSSILGLINLIEQANDQERDVIIDHLKTCSDQLDNITRQISRNLESGIIDS